MINLDIGAISLAQLEEGILQGGILLLREGIPVAEVRPLPLRPKKPRPLGLARGTFTIPPSFFEPL